MEKSQRNSLSSFLKQRKMSFFLLQDRRTRRTIQVLSGVLATVGGGGSGKRVWEGKYGVNTMHTHVNRKMIPVETIPGTGRGQDKGE
jgi:hypothetical protein